MKTAKQRKLKGEQASVQCNISKSLTGVKRSRKSSEGQRHKNAGRGSSSETSSDIKEEGERKPHSSAKIKLQLFPLDERTRKGLEKDNHNPFLELTLSARKKLSSVLERLCNKWGSSSIATGQLMLFPFSTSKENLVMCKKWTSSEPGITAGDVHAAVGSPDIFRLRYGWVSTQMINLASSPSLGYPESVHLERVSCCTMETTCGTNIETEVKSKKSQPSNSNEVTNLAVERKTSAEPHLVVHMNQTEGSRMQNDLSFTSILWSDLSNISIGGLLSEASLQGRFSTPDIKGGRKLVPQPNAVISDSLDAFIDQLKSPQALRNLSPDMPLSILDAENTCQPPDGASSILDVENTCHSFACSKLPPSKKDFLTPGRSAFSELCNQAVASRHYKYPKSEANAQDVARTVEDPKTDTLPYSVGVYNNENSLGLSSIRWNDSLGPFDLPLTSRQIIKDDSITIGRFAR